MRVRDWTGVDYYRELGVRPTATRDEIAVAFRTRARVLHPDTAPADPASEAAFVRAATAYEILTGPMREEYDRARRRGQVRPAGAAARASVPSAGATGARGGGGFRGRVWPATSRGGRIALWGGLIVMLAGIVVAVLVVTLQVRDARLRTEGVAATALVVRERGVPRLQFTTESGRVVRSDLPDRKSGGRSAGDALEIRYDPEDPERIVTAQHAVGRDITLWIVAVKLLTVGAVLAVLGARRLLKHDDA